MTYAITFVFFIMFASTSVCAEKYWLGFYASDNSGISFKDWQSRKNAHDYGLGWSLAGKLAIHAKVDYLTHNYKLIDLPEGKLPVYYGLGVGVAIGPEVVSGIRFPVGANYLFDKIPFDLFLEVIPMLHLYPSTIVNVTGAVGVRYHFHSL